MPPHVLRLQRGVTLVELLMSMAVASILLVALLQALTSASDSWTRQSRGVEAQREGRAAMRILVDDLQAAVAIPRTIRQLSEVTLAASNTTAPAATPAPARPVPWEEKKDPASEARTGFWLETGAAPGENSRLAFLRSGEGSARGGDLGRGDLRLVLYGTVFSEDPTASGLASARLSQKLVRRVLGPVETHQRLRAALANQKPLVRPEDWTGLMTPPAAGSDASVAIVAHDVVGFRVGAFDDLALERFAVPVPATHVPRWLDVTLRLTNSQTSRWLETEAEWRGGGVEGARLTQGTPDDFSDDAEVRTYTMRTALPGDLLSL